MRLHYHLPTPDDLSAERWKAKLPTYLRSWIRGWNLAIGTGGELIMMISSMDLTLFWTLKGWVSCKPAVTFFFCLFSNNCPGQLPTSVETGRGRTELPRVREVMSSFVKCYLGWW